MLVSSPMARAARRLGLVSSAAVTKARKELSELADPADFVALQAHLNRLGEMEDDAWPPSLGEYVD